MEELSVYIPMDRRYALAHDKPLPERMVGASLFADISGFTPLTEVLTMELGQRRGAEELTIHLNRVYNALIAELHRYGGSVLSFSGDAITCWLDGDDGRRATAAALAMQATMHQFKEITTVSGRVVSLAIKVAVVSGPIRRFVVGNASYLLADVIAGSTLDLLAIAEQLAGRNEVVLDETTVGYLGNALKVTEWRVDDNTGRRFAVVSALNLEVANTPWVELDEWALSEDVKASWLLPPIYQRLKMGMGEFLAEFRPTFSLFFRFSGLDFDRDAEAPVLLNGFISEVQLILKRLSGSLIQITIGDKGSYCYIVYGAPIAHEDDAVRVANTALELQALTSRFPVLQPLQIGITSGLSRTGAYGSTTRRTYGVLGDSVNLSARLMSAAEPGQILVNDSARLAIGDAFLWRRLPDKRFKGKKEPEAVFQLLEPNPNFTAQPTVPANRLPIIGRQKERQQLHNTLKSVLHEGGQIVGLTAEAGMGKSRLAVEVLHMAQKQGFIVLSGECQSYGTMTSYLVWQQIWRSFFNLPASQPDPEQIQAIETQLHALDPALIARMPLLGAVLNLAIPDNDLTRSLDAKVRKSSLEDLLVRCLDARAGERPLLLLLEDIHWIDELSADLLQAIGKMVKDFPIMLLLVYRQLDTHQKQALRLTDLPYFEEIALAEFQDQETRQLVERKLSNLFGNGRSMPIPPSLLTRLTEQAAGNPFYIEELLNYLKDLGIQPDNPDALQAINLPRSLHALILSRLDQLNQSQQLTIKIASVVGRLFPAAIIWGIYPELPAGQVEQDLQSLNRLDLTILDTPEPEITYLFKHILTQQVAYESLLFSTRATLHEQIGGYIEQTYPDALDQYTYLLAHHFENSLNERKKREYLLLAASDAQQKYAHEAAIAYYERALPLVPPAEKVAVMLKLGEALYPVGRWSEAETLLKEALNLARQQGDLRGRAACQLALAELLRKQGHFDDAAAHLARARANYDELNDPAGMGQALHSAGTLIAQQGDYQTARELYEASLEIRRLLNDEPNIANLLNNLGVIARFQGDHDRARVLYGESRAIREKLGDKHAISVSLTNLGLLALSLEDLGTAQRRLEEAIALTREVGDRWSIANALNNLANVMREKGDFRRARKLYQESLVINWGLGDQRAIAFVLEDIGCLAALEEQPEIALCLAAAATALRDEIGAPLAPNDQKKLQDNLAPARKALTAEEQAAAVTRGKQMSLDEAVDFASYS